MSRNLAMTSGLQRVLSAAQARRGVAVPRLDFENPSAPRRALNIVLLGLGLLACALVGSRFESIEADRAGLEAASAMSAAPPPTRAVKAISSTGMSKATALRAEQANGIIARLAMPWDDWFSQLESASTGKVVLSALQPEAEGRRVRISGEARRFDELVDYMMRLEDTPGFANVFLTEHSEATPGSTAVSFSLSADWVGGTP